MSSFATIQTYTLAQRLAEGSIPPLEALRLAVLLADALHTIHDTGCAHGAVSPATIALSGPGLELLDAPASPEAVTPYTAPEVLQGSPPDALSDIFSLGAVVFEMLTGRRVFEGASADELRGAILMSPHPSSGTAAVDRFLGSCLAKDRAERLHPMQKVVTALKLLAVTERCAEADSAKRKEAADAILRAEMRRIDARLTAQLQAHEVAMADMRSAGTGALNTLREEFHAMGAEFAAGQSRAEQSQESFGERITTRVQQIINDIEECVTRAESSAGAAEAQATRAAESMAAVDQRIARLEQGASAAGERMARVEQGLESGNQLAASLHDAVAAHDAAIETGRLARAQTDDLVERVVEALELLQLTLLDQAEQRATA